MHEGIATRLLIFFASVETEYIGRHVQKDVEMVVTPVPHSEANLAISAQGVSPASALLYECAFSSSSSNI